MTDADASRTIANDVTADGTYSIESVVTAHSSAPGRTVLTERGNTDGWIASDVTYELER